MNRVERISNNIAYRIHANTENSSSVAVLSFALINLINFSIIIAIVLIVCAITGDLLNGLIASLALPVLRYFSGGLHFKSSHVCNVISAGMVLISVYISVQFYWTGFLIMVVSATILAFNAPSGIKRSKIPSKYYPVLTAIVFAA